MPPEPSTAAAPRPAATLILVREQAGRVETYLLRRSAGSRFMGGYYVFPGGTLEADDQREVLWTACGDLDPAQLAARLGDGRAGRAGPFAVAAIRESLEECGVLLAGGGRGLAALLAQARLPQRPAGWFSEAIVNGGWTLCLSALHPWSRWITPVQMPRRYDTRFLLAVLPEGQSCRPDGRETTDGRWVTPRQALAENLAGRLPLSPPTLVTLHEMLAWDRMDQLLAAARGRTRPIPVQPRLVALDEGPLIIEPWDPSYDCAKPEVDGRGLAAAVLPVGEPFSRLWCHRGLWRPVAAC